METTIVEGLYRGYIGILYSFGVLDLGVRVSDLGFRV